MDAVSKLNDQLNERYNNPNDYAAQRYKALVEEYYVQLWYDSCAEEGSRFLNDISGFLLTGLPLETIEPVTDGQEVIRISEIDFDTLSDRMMTEIIPSTVMASTTFFEQPYNFPPSLIQRDIEKLVEMRAEAFKTERVALGADPSVCNREVTKWLSSAMSNLPTALEEIYHEDTDRVGQGINRLLPRHYTPEMLEALWCRTANLMSYPPDEFAWRQSRYNEIYDSGVPCSAPYAPMKVIEENAVDAGGTERENPAVETKPSGTSIFSRPQPGAPVTMPKSGSRPKRPPIGA